MSEVTPFIGAFCGGSWCLLRAYVLARRFETDAAVPFLFVGATGYVLGGIGAVLKLFG